MGHPLIQQAKAGDIRAVARCISYIENEQPGYEELLLQLSPAAIPVIGITGPPGAGKSTLTNALIGHYVSQGAKVAVLCVDPSSPFNLGALLGDRIRMNEWYVHPQVFIRSLASRGSLGGLHPHIIEITDMLKSVGFDQIIVETVGIGQSEIEIAGLADVTVVVLVPEAGDEIQTMKSGLMEIADVFVVNKADRPGADTFISNLRKIQAPGTERGKAKKAVIKAVATEKKGIEELARAIESHLQTTAGSERKYQLLAEKAYQLIREKRMKDISRQELSRQIKSAAPSNLYQFLRDHYDL